MKHKSDLFAEDAIAAAEDEDEAVEGDGASGSVG